MSKRRGIVYLVGAGPGDPGLITVRGRRLLRKADVVVHDRLIDRRLLDEAPADAERIDAGKSPGDHALEQSQINAILVERARRGERVVRLKGGDPFVFGRGWEEYSACREAGVRCIVVPGITSAIAAPAAASIPLTHRGTSRSFAVVTARTQKDCSGLGLDYAALAGIDTVVILMGRANLDETARSLIAAGKDAQTPAACIERGTTSRQRVARAVLADIAAATEEMGLSNPVVTVVGDVAALAEMNQFQDGLEAIPLLGKRFVVTSAIDSAASLARRLEARGAIVVRCPLIEISYPDSSEENDSHRLIAGAPRDYSPLDSAIMRLDSYEWIMFTSRHGVEGVRRRLRSLGKDVRTLGHCRVAAVGPATARKLRRLGVMPNLVPSIHTAAALVEALGPSVKGRRVLWPCGDIARDELATGLRRHGAEVDAAIAYRTIPAGTAGELNAAMRGPDAIVFASPSAVRRFVELGDDASSSAVACIGPTTAAAAREAGLAVDVVAGRHTAAGLVEAICEHFLQAGAHV